MDNQQIPQENGYVPRVKKRNLKPLLIMIGIIAIFCAGSIGFITAAFKPYEKNDSFKLSNTKSIVVDASAANVSIVPTNGKDVNISITGGSTYTPSYDVTNSGDKLSIEFNKGIKVGVMYSKLELTVEIPKDYRDDISVKTSAGSVYFGITRIGEVYVSSSSGSVEIDDIKCEDMKVTASSGSIKIGDVECEEFTVTSSSGSIKIDTIKAEETTIKASSGSITIDSLKADEADVNSSSGTVKIKDVNKTSLAVKSSSGSVDVTYSEFGKNNDINLKCSSGSITLALPSSAQFSVDAKTSSGSVNSDFTINASTSKSNRLIGQTSDKAESEIKLDASSGSIKIKKN